MSLDFTMYRFADYPMHPDTDVGSLEWLPLATVAEVRDLISVQLSAVDWESFIKVFVRFRSDLCIHLIRNKFRSKRTSIRGLR